MVFQEFIDWLQNPDFLLNLVLILLFPAIFDWSRTIAKIVFIKLKTRHQDSEKNPYFRVHDKKVSILIPAYNEESCIRESIEAALATFYPNKEILVIDDHSTDKTYSIAKEYADKNLIKLLYRKTDGSKAEALNYGYLYSKGEMIVTTDADTKLDVHSLEHVVRNFDDEDVMAVSGNVSISSGDENVNNLLTDLQKYEYQNAFEIGKTFSSLFGTLLLASGAFSAFRREAINWEGRFRKETLGEDFDKSIKIKKMGKKIIHVKEAIAHTHCPNNFDALKRQRNRWASGQMTTVLQHRTILFCSRYNTKFRLALWDMMMMDVVLNIVSIVAMMLLFAVILISIIIHQNFSFLEYIVYKLSFLIAIYITLEVTLALFYLNHPTNPISLKTVGLILIMILVYRPIMKIITMKGHLSTIMGIKNSW